MMSINTLCAVCVNTCCQDDITGTVHTWSTASLLIPQWRHHSWQYSRLSHTHTYIRLLRSKGRLVILLHAGKAITYFDHLAWSPTTVTLWFYYIIFIQFRRVLVLNGYMYYNTFAHCTPFSLWIFSYKSTFQYEAVDIEQGLMWFWIHKYPRINLLYWRML